MKLPPLLFLFLCACTCATLSAKTTPATGQTQGDRKTGEKSDDPEEEAEVVAAKKIYRDAQKELRDAESAMAPAAKVAELTKAKDAAGAALKEARKVARKRIAEKKAAEAKAKRTAKK